jgi:hypothetical protein
MQLLNLPPSTKVDKVISKNLFDSYCNSSQKKYISEYIQKILWMNKLSKETIHLEGKSIQEIQFIKIELKKKDRIPKILNIIDQSMPYVIIFFIQHIEEFYMSTSVKHISPKNENLSIIDWTFQSEWWNIKEKSIEVSLQNNLDIVYHKFCVHLSGQEFLSHLPFKDFISVSKKRENLLKEIESLKKKISSTKQFNEKVELNVRLNELTNELKKYSA